MKPSDKVVPLLKIGMLILLAGWAAVSLGRAVIQSFSPAGGNDLYTYWYAGHFLREGKDYYRAFLEGELPSVPVRYLDREVEDLDEVIFPGLVPAPASTAPAFFLLLPLACLSWNIAKAVWLVINLALLALISILLVRFLHPGRWLEREECLGLSLFLVGMTSTRYAAASGQLTFLFLALLLGTMLLAGRRPWLAGVLLGLALSKYSISAGILLYFVFLEPRPRLVLAAALVQLAGVAGLSLLSGTDMLTIVAEYVRMAGWHADMEGVHLAAALGLQGWASLLASLLLTALVGGVLAIWRFRRGPDKFLAPLPRPARGHLFTILILWALLVAYHRAYDVMLMIVFFGLVLLLAKAPDDWLIHPVARKGLLAFGAAAALLLMVPSGSLVRGLLPASLETIWGLAANWTATLLIGCALLASLWLLFHLRPNSNPPAER